VQQVAAAGHQGHRSPALDAVRLEQPAHARDVMQRGLA
jgi:hypothetical protein